MIVKGRPSGAVGWDGGDEGMGTVIMHAAGDPSGTVLPEIAQYPKST